MDFLFTIPLVLASGCVLACCSLLHLYQHPNIKLGNSEKTIGAAMSCLLRYIFSTHFQSCAHTLPRYLWIFGITNFSPPKTKHLCVFSSNCFRARTLFGQKLRPGLANEKATFPCWKSHREGFCWISIGWIWTIEIRRFKSLKLWIQWKVGNLLAFKIPHHNGKIRGKPGPPPILEVPVFLSLYMW